MGGLGALVILWCYRVLKIRRDVKFILGCETYGWTGYSPVSAGVFSWGLRVRWFLHVVSRRTLGWSFCGLDLHPLLRKL